LYVLIVHAHSNRIDRTNLLAKATKDTSRPIDLVDPRESFPVLVFFCLHIDAIRGADRLAKAASHAFCGPVFSPFKIVDPPPSIGHFNLFFRILSGKGLRKKVFEGNAQTL
jgi:hypothetical protein